MKLPLWRLILALLVLGGMAAVLISLVPVYFENYQLGRYIKQLVRDSNSPDEKLRAAILARAHELDLPVQPEDVEITHSDGKLKVHTKCKVQMDFPLYQVDLHVGSNAASK